MWRCRPSVRRSRTGFSLVELMVVVALLGIFFGLVYESLITGLRTVDAADDREAVRQQLAGALDRFTRETSAANDVEEAEQLDGSTTGEFQFDTPSVDDVEYRYDASADTLSRRDDDDTTRRVIARYVTSLDLSYYDASGNLLAEPVSSANEDLIRVVRVVATATISNETITVASAAYLRNM